MSKIVLLIFLVVPAAAAQSDLCWRECYPLIPGEWAGAGSVVEAGNRFRTTPGATLELWRITKSYDEARQSAVWRRVLPGTLVETVTSDERGSFRFQTLQRAAMVQAGSYEIRVRMPGRESSLAYTEIGKGAPPQWVGRGIKVALSSKGQGCSRIYAAGLDDTDCGFDDCENLPSGPTRIALADGIPLRNTRLDFYQHSKKRSLDPEFSLTTNTEGVVATPPRRGCFDVEIQSGGSMHLCFRGKPMTHAVRVVLPSNTNQ